jgi:hypothetical protein
MRRPDHAQVGRVIRIESDQALGDMATRPAPQQRQHVLSVLERQRALPGAFHRACDPEAIVELRQQRLAVAVIDDQPAGQRELGTLVEREPRATGAQPLEIDDARRRPAVRRRHGLNWER